MSATSGPNCTDVPTPQDREQTLLLQQIAFLAHGGLLLFPVLTFLFYVQRRIQKGESIDWRTPTILALRLGRELLENTLMWAAMLNIAVITNSEAAIYILVSAVPATVIVVHVQAVLAFRKKVLLHDDRIESTDVAICFHFNSYFAKKTWLIRVVVVASVPVFTIVALCTSAAAGRIADVSLTTSECTASFLLAFFSATTCLKPATFMAGTQSVVSWDYEPYQRTLLRRAHAERAMKELKRRERYACPQALASKHSTLGEHAMHFLLCRSTLMYPSRMVVFRESTHLAWADHRNEPPLSVDTIATVTRKSSEEIALRVTPKSNKLGPGWGTMFNLLMRSDRSARQHTPRPPESVPGAEPPDERPPSAAAGGTPLMPQQPQQPEAAATGSVETQGTAVAGHATAAASAEAHTMTRASSSGVQPSATTASTESLSRSLTWSGNGSSAVVANDEALIA